MPLKGSILHVGLDGNRDICLWAAVDPNDPVMDIEIIIAGTGHPLPHIGDYIGTVQQHGFIWHVFTGPGHSANKTVSFHYQTKEN